MLKKLLLAALLFAISSGPVISAAGGQSGLPGTLVDIALRDNPELLAAKARWQVYSNRIAPAASLDDPTLSFSLNNYPVDTLKDDETPMTGKVLKLSQKFPFPGKLAAREDAARLMSLWYKGVYEDGRLTLARQVKYAYFKIYYLDKAIEITEKNAQLLQDFIKLTETSYEVGTGLQQDVLKAQVERSRLSDRLLDLKQKRQTALAGLNTLLNRVPDYRLPAIPEVTATDMDLPAAELRQRARKNRPLFAAYKSLMASYKAKKALARLNYKPDFNAGLAYTFREPNAIDQGTDFAGVEIGINIPIFTAKRDAALAEADAGLMMVRRQYENFQNQVNFDIDDALQDLRKNRQQALLYKTGIIPQANQSFNSAMSAYKVGKVSFLTLLDDLMTLYRYEIDYYRALTDGERDMARLEAASGLELMKN